MAKGPDAFRTISEVAETLDLPQHVLRFWETRFSQIKPMKRGGGRRFYRPDDIALLAGIKHLLYGEGYTIRGVQRILKEQGVRAVAAVAETGVVPGRAVDALPKPALQPARLPAPQSEPQPAPVTARAAPEPSPVAPAAVTPAPPAAAAEPAPVVVRRVKALSEADAGRLRQVVADLSDMKRLIDQTV